MNTGFFLLLAVVICIPFSMKGIVKALQLFQQQLIDHKVSIFVRRGGPNYQEGLRIMRELGKSALLIFFCTCFIHFGFVIVSSRCFVNSRMM